LLFSYSGETREAWSEGWWEFSFNDVGAAAVMPWSLQAVDHASNPTELDGSVERPAGVESTLVITELLANPLGPEPRAEFIELSHVGEAPVSTAGLFVADLPWDEIQATLEEGSEPPGDPLPDVEVLPREVILVVADGFDVAENAEAGDSLPPPDTQLLRIGSSIADGGLKNAGEPLSLYRPDPPELLSSYGNWIASDASDFGGVSVERRDPGACDGAGDWRPGRGGKASPGRLP
jgi:hypothetical protein